MLYIGMVQNTQTGISKPVCVTDNSPDHAIKLIDHWIRLNDTLGSIYVSLGVYTIDSPFVILMMGANFVNADDLVTRMKKCEET